MKKLLTGLFALAIACSLQAMEGGEEEEIKRKTFVGEHEKTMRMLKEIGKEKYAQEPIVVHLIIDNQTKYKINFDQTTEGSLKDSIDPGKISELNVPFDGKFFVFKITAAGQQLGYFRVFFNPAKEEYVALLQDSPALRTIVEDRIKPPHEGKKMRFQIRVILKTPEPTFGTGTRELSDSEIEVEAILVGDPEDEEATGEEGKQE